MNFRRQLNFRSASAAMDITPLIDVVFILLIFLLVSTTFKSQEQAFSIVLPVGDQQARVTKVVRPTVFVTKSGNYILYTPGEDPKTPVQGTAQMTLPELSDALKQLADGSEGEAAINIKGDAQTDYQRILDVVNECQRHKLGRIYFPYKKGEPSK
jgi:biopolymer transport protein ExbD